MSADWIWWLETKIESKTDEAQRILNDLLAKLEEAGWGMEHHFPIHLAVEEALMNAIKHGNQRDPDKKVLVQCGVSTEKMQILIEDEGDGFDPTAVPDPTEDENLDLPSGRGLHLMKSFMTRVEYNEKGNRVEMEKLKDDPAGGGDDDDDDDFYAAD